MAFKADNQGVDEEDIRRQAILARIGETPDAASVLDRTTARQEGIGASAPVFDRAAADAETARYLDRFNAGQETTRPSVIERTEQRQNDLGGSDRVAGVDFMPPASRVDTREEQIGAAGAAPVGGTPGRFQSPSANPITALLAHGPGAVSDETVKEERRVLSRTPEQQAALSPLAHLGGISPVESLPGLQTGLEAIGSKVGPLASAIGKRIGALRGSAPAAVEDVARAAPKSGPRFPGDTGSPFDNTWWENNKAFLEKPPSTVLPVGPAAEAVAPAGRDITDLASAIGARLGRLPGIVKVGVPLAAAGVGAGLVEGGLTPPGAATPTPDTNRQNASSPITDAYLRTKAGTPLPGGPAAPAAPVGAPPASGFPLPGEEPREPGQPPAGPGAQPPAGPPPYDRAHPLPPGPFPPNSPYGPGKGPYSGPPKPAGQPPAATPVLETPPGQMPRGGPGVVPGVTPSGTKTGPTTGPLPQNVPTSTDLRTQVTADLNGIAQQLNAGPQPPDVMALFVSQGQKLLDLINQQETQLRSEADQQGKTVDPGTQNVLDTLREELGRQIKATKEELNARGLLDSGILIEAEQMLRKGNMSDQAKILSERLSRIQDNLNSSLSQLRQQRVSTQSTFGLAGAQAQTAADAAERQRLDALRQLLIQGRLGVAGQVGQEEQANAQRDFQAQQAELEQQAAFARQAASLAAQAGDAAAQREWQARENDLNRQNQILLARMSEATRTAPQTPAEKAAGAAAGDATSQALAVLGQFTTYQDAISAFVEAAPTLQAQGVDLATVQREIERRFKR